MGKDELLVHEQSSPFGTIATGEEFPDTFACIPDTGFEWTIFISRCGNRTDSIFMRVEFSDDPGVQYEIAGYRRTGFLEDEH